MTKPLPFTQASIRRAVLGARSAGLRVTGIRPDGTVMVDEGEGPVDLSPPVAPNQASSRWEDAEA